MTIESIYQTFYSDGSKGWYMNFANQQRIKIMAKQAKEIIKLFALKKGPIVDLENSTIVYYKN